MIELKLLQLKIYLSNFTVFDNLIENESASSALHIQTNWNVHFQIMHIYFQDGEKHK